MQRRVANVAEVVSGHRIGRHVFRQEHRTVDSLTIESLPTGMDREDCAGGVHAGNPSPAPARLTVTVTVKTPPCPDCRRQISVTAAEHRGSRLGWRRKREVPRVFGKRA